MSSSLTEAFLFEPAPYDVWIADLGATAPAGSGTQADPWNGSSRADTPISVTSLTKEVGTHVAIATATNHGFQNGDMVTILGVTGSGNYFYYNGTFAVHSVTSSTFKYTMLGDPGTSSPTGTVTCVREQERFDVLMRNMPANTAIHLGEGVFPTKGFAGGIAGGWMAKSAQKLLGAGMRSTTIRLVKAVQPNIGTAAIFGGSSVGVPHTGFVAEDFTIDCNMAGQPIPQGANWAPVCCAAIFINGEFVRFRRIRAINYGTQNPAECFVISAGGGTVEQPEVRGCVIEDCICEQPAHNSVYVTTHILVAAGQNPTTGQEAFHRGCAVRNCYIDGDFVDNPVPIASLSVNAGVATVTTRHAHGRVSNDWVVISGVLDNGATSLVLNGWFQITVADSDTFTYPVSGSTGTLSGDMWVGKWPGLPVGVQTRNGTQPVQNITAQGGGIYRIKAHAPHFRRLENNVLIQGVANALGGVSPFNGAFKTHAIVSPTELDFIIPSAPNTNTIDWLSSNIFIGVGGNGITADTGTATVVEGNRVIGIWNGFYHDTGSTRDLTIRDNYFYRADIGIHQNMDLFSAAVFGTGFNGVTSTSGNRNPTRSGLTATFKTPATHGFLPGQIVRITNVRVNGFLDNPFNGEFVVTPTSDTTFTYLMSSAPSADGDEGVTPQFSNKYQVRRMVIENNVIDLVWNIHPHGWGQPFGIRIGAGPEQYTYFQATIRNNIIRHFDGTVDPAGWAISISLQGLDSALVESNLIDMSDRFVFDNSCNIIKAFDNRSSSGQRIFGFNLNTQAVLEEFSDRLDDVMVLSI